MDSETDRSFPKEAKNRSKNYDNPDGKNVSPLDSFGDEDDVYNAWKRHDFASDVVENDRDRVRSNKSVKIPDNFPGVSNSWRENITESHEPRKKKIVQHEETVIMNITLDDMQRVLSPREKTPRRRKEWRRTALDLDERLEQQQSSGIEQSSGTGNMVDWSSSSHGIGHTCDGLTTEGGKPPKENNSDTGTYSGGLTKGGKSPRVKMSGIEAYNPGDTLAKENSSGTQVYSPRYKLPKVTSSGTEVHSSGDKLPSIGAGKNGGVQIPHSQSLPNSPRLVGSTHFNVTRLMTELENLCQINDKAGDIEQASNSEVKAQRNDTKRPMESEVMNLSLKMVHEARRSSVFTPRREGRHTFPSHHSRHRSLPNITVPQRYFVKLDPLRASATPVNLSARNSESARRCRTLSENLQKLDESGTVLSEAERKKLVKQWVRETTKVQLSYEKDYKHTEIES